MEKGTFFFSKLQAAEYFFHFCCGCYMVHHWNFWTAWKIGGMAGLPLLIEIFLYEKLIFSLLALLAFLVEKLTHE
jgi:hypothetical protein